MDQSRLNELHDWLEAQTAYWQSLLSDQEIDPVDWQMLLDTCKRIAEDQAPHIRSELSESMAEQVRGFCRVGERLLRALKQEQRGPELEEAVSEFNAHLMDQADSRLMKFWQLSGHLNQFLSNSGLNVGAAGAFELLDSFSQGAQNFRKRYQQIEQCYLEFNNALREFMRLQGQTSRQTNQQLLAELKASDQALSLSDLHGLWVECYETCYRQQILTTEYQRAYGRLSNASLALQKLAREYWEQEYRSLGLVPAKDYTQLLERHHQLRKKHKLVVRELDHVQQQLTDLQQQQQNQQSEIDDRLNQLDKQLKRLAGKNIKQP